MQATMFLTVHGPTGALIGALTEDPLSAFVLSMCSHAVLDMIPHGDERLGEDRSRGEKIRFLCVLATFDGLLMLAVLTVVLQPWRVAPSLSVLAGIAGGALPDVLQGLGELLPRVRWLAWWKRVHDVVHVRIIAYETSLPIGLAIQLAALALAVSGLRVLR